MATSFNNSPGGCCCDLGHGYFDLWYGWSYEPTIQDYGPTTAVSHVFLGGGMTFEGNTLSLNTDTAGEKWWNSFDQDNWFLQPKIEPKTWWAVRDYGGTVFAIEVAKDTNIEYLTRYGGGGETGRYPKQTLNDAFNNAAYNEWKYNNGFEVIQTFVGNAIPGFFADTLSYGSMGQQGTINNLDTTHAAQWWHKPEGFTMLSYPVPMWRFYVNWDDGTCAGTLTLPVLDGGEYTLKPLTTQVAGTYGFGPARLACDWIPSGVAVEDPNSQLSFYGGKLVCQDTIISNRTLSVKSDVQGGTVYDRDDNHIYLAAHIQEVVTEAARYVCPNGWVAGVKGNRVGGWYSAPPPNMGGPHDIEMFLEFHVRKAQIIGDDDSGQVYRIPCVDSTSNSTSLVKRVSCNAKWGEYPYGGYIPPIDGGWEYFHAHGDCWAGILAYSNLTWGIGDDRSLEQKYYTELYINGHMFRQLPFSLTPHLFNTIFNGVTQYHPYLGFPYVRSKSDGSGQVALITPKYITAPTEENRAGTFEINGNVTNEILLFNEGGGVISTHPVPYLSYVIGASRTWFYVMVSGKHTAEEVSGGKFCYVTPERQLDDGAVWLLNENGFVPYGVVYKEKVSGRFAVSPFTEIGHIGTDFPYHYQTLYSVSGTSPHISTGYPALGNSANVWGPLDKCAMSSGAGKPRPIPDNFQQMFSDAQSSP